MLQGPSVSKFLNAYCLRPIVALFSQRPNEQVILILRAHPVTQLGWVINTIFLFFLFSLALYSLGFLLSPGQYLFVTISGYVLIFNYGWINFIRWFYNVGVITTERILDFDFEPLITKRVDATIIANIEQVFAKQSGFAGSILNYGNVFVETAGGAANIEFTKVPLPLEVVQIINNLMHTKTKHGVPSVQH